MCQLIFAPLVGPPRSAVDLFSLGRLEHKDAYSKLLSARQRTHGNDHVEDDDFTEETAQRRRSVRAQQALQAVEQNLANTEEENGSPQPMYGGRSVRPRGPPKKALGGLGGSSSKGGKPVRKSNPVPKTTAPRPTYGYQIIGKYNFCTLPQNSYIFRQITISQTGLNDTRMRLDLYKGSDSWKGGYRFWQVSFPVSTFCYLVTLLTTVSNPVHPGSSNQWC